MKNLVEVKAKGLKRTDFLLKREAKIIGVMQAQPDGSMDDWVALAYDDVDPRIWPVAKRSLLAHVERVRELALVIQE